MAPAWWVSARKWLRRPGAECLGVFRGSLELWAVIRGWGGDLRGEGRKGGILQSIEGEVAAQRKQTEDLRWQAEGGRRRQEEEARLKAAKMVERQREEIERRQKEERRHEDNT